MNFFLLKCKKNFKLIKEKDPEKQESHCEDFMKKIDFSQIELKDLACLIYNTLKKHGIEAVLVGGACVTIYSHNRYQSYNLDFVTYHDMKKVEEALTELNFKRKGRLSIFGASDPSCPRT